MITINSCGHNSHHRKPCNIEHKAGVEDHLILLIKKEAWCFLNGRKYLLHPNALLLFPPKTYIHYGCDTIGYSDDWIHFTMEEEDLCFFSSLHIPSCQIIYPYDFHQLSEYVRLLSDNFHSASAYKRQITDSFMRIFLYSLKESLENPPGNSVTRKYYQSFSGLRTQIYNNPANPWTIHGLAASLCLSPSYFQHLYKDFFHCSCQQDIITARLKLAKYYLATSTMGIGEIADFCGYENELHFMRQFKKFVGVTPTNYRRNAK
ncbi:MAG: helix-turn-helix transcriptional regulator [Hungatella sp.]|nr:helix-turn-helix transcriptional regulator [Hungatella sp.]